MKIKRILSLLLAVLCVCSLASGALAADTDTQSQATQKRGAELAPDSEAAQDSEAQSTPHTKKGGKKQEAAEPENAIGKDAAKEIALADAGLSAEQVEKVRARVSDADGTVVYKVHFTYDGQRYSYRIDALSGEIIDKKVSDASETPSHGKCARDGGKSKRSASTAEEASGASV